MTKIERFQLCQVMLFSLKDNLPRLWQFGQSHLCLKKYAAQETQMDMSYRQQTSTAAHLSCFLQT